MSDKTKLENTLEETDKIMYGAKSTAKQERFALYKLLRDNTEATLDTRKQLNGDLSKKLKAHKEQTKAEVKEELRIEKLEAENSKLWKYLIIGGKLVALGIGIAVIVHAPQYGPIVLKMLGFVGV